MYKIFIEEDKKELQFFDFEDGKRFSIPVTDYELAGYKTLLESESKYEYLYKAAKEKRSKYVVELVKQKA